MRKERSGAAASAASAVLFNLLDEALLGVEDQTGARYSVTLPGLLARWSRGELIEMTALQAHQQHAWHAFTVQLAALALARANTSDLPTEESAWRELLVACAAGDGAGPEAFALVVEDLSKPAFMQPAVPEGTLKVLKNVHDAPSGELDVLITAKNHDVKTEPFRIPSPEDWALSLVTLQTMQGFLGAGNYGIARMNGGFSSRPCVAYGTGVETSHRFQRDARRMLEEREQLRVRGFGKRRILGLLWCEPWDGMQSLGIDEIDPFFIEICRRVRLTQKDNLTLRAHRGSTKVARIAGSNLSGNTGDAWTPVAQDGKALTMPESGFTYDRVQSLMFGEWAHGAAGTARETDSDAIWFGRVLVRGQGKTGGYHERWIPVPSGARKLLFNQETRSGLGRRAKYWVDRAAATKLRVLKPGVLAFLQGGPDKVKFDDPRAEPVLRRFDEAIDRVFFPLLFEHATSQPEEADDAFETKLFQIALAELERAFEALPTSTARRARAIAHGERLFYLNARRVLGLPRGLSGALSKEGATT